MAFDPAPGSWIPDWSEDGTDITVPLATFPELTAEEADAETGDIRKVVWALMQQLYEAYNETPTADRPTKWTMNKVSSINSITGVVTNIFTMTMYTEITTQEMLDES